MLTAEQRAQLIWYRKLYSRTSRDPATRAVAHAARREFEAIQRAATRALAEERGWAVPRVGTDPHAVLLKLGAQRLEHWEARWPVIDHSQHFAVGGRSRAPAALLSHTYSPLTQIAAFARRHSLAYEVLPVSWYYPHPNCTAVLFLPLKSQRNERP